jgi:hypothetical protein
MPVGSPTMQPSGFTPRATMSSISRRTPMQPISSSYGQREMQRPREPAAHELGHHREPGRREALHVGDAAADDAVADHRRLERIGVPRLPVHGHDVGVPRQHDASGRRVAVARRQRREEVRLSPVVVERERALRAVRFEIAAHPVDQRKVRFAARRIESNERSDHLPGDEPGVVNRGLFRAQCGGRAGSVHWRKLLRTEGGARWGKDSG